MTAGGTGAGGAGPPQDWIEGCLAAQASLDAALGGLDDATARSPSLLPDWSVGHVLTHIARNADSVVWRLEGAALGELRERSAPSKTARGVVEPSRDAIFSRWREVVVHHGDLGFAPVPLPPALVSEWLARELPRLDERTDPADLLAWIIGRAEAPALAPW
jgi:maleylpyruvate isomerase